MVPPLPTTLRAARSYKSSRRARKNWPERPPGVSQRRPPECTACILLPSSCYKLVVRLLLKEGVDLTSQAILDTRIGPTLISRHLLPDATELHPLGEVASMFHDVNEGWLPIVGSVFLGMALGGQTSYIFFGVVDNMSVPAILGTSFMDIATKNIGTQEQHVELLMVPRYQYDETVPARGTRSRQSVMSVRVPKGAQLSEVRPGRTWYNQGISHTSP